MFLQLEFDVRAAGQYFLFFVYVNRHGTFDAEIQRPRHGRTVRERVLQFRSASKTHDIRNKNLTPRVEKKEKNWK